MTRKELYQWAKNQIGEECVLLTQAFLGASRQDIILHGEKQVENPKVFLEAVEKRRSGYPLQYILGFWYFDHMELWVQEGVLIPREDTLALTELAVSHLPAGKKMIGYDLCAGTGAVALSVSRRLPQAEITAVELYDVPFACLTKNIAQFGKGRVLPQRGDVQKGPAPQIAGTLDFIVSNPPYIARAELPGLQQEVQHEPREALDGGVDGLLFYRALAEKWKVALKPGGILAVEIGETQGEAVAALFAENGFTDLHLAKDACAHPRAVCGRTPL